MKDDFKNLFIKGFNRTERHFLVLYYYERMTIKEISAVLDLSEYDVFLIYSSTIALLKDRMSSIRKEYLIRTRQLKIKQREQHYIFAHETLRNIYFKTPKKVLFDLIDDNWKMFLIKLWNETGQNLKKACCFAHDSLSRLLIKHNNNIVVALITLPKPQAVSEAYFVAMVHESLKRRFLSKQKYVIRFLLLEKSVPSGYGNQTTALYELTADGKHINLGYGCEPNLEAFYEAVCDLL